LLEIPTARSGAGGGMKETLSRPRMLKAKPAAVPNAARAVEKSCCRLAICQLKTTSLSACWQILRRRPQSIGWPAVSMPTAPRGKPWGLARLCRLCESCRWQRANSLVRARQADGWFADRPL